MTAVEKVISTARAEVGYVEKATNAQLDSRTGNAGSGNWTKYARDLDGIGTVYNGKKNGYSWCDVFVDWCFITTFGLETGMALLCQPYKGLGAGCTYSMRYYKSKNRFYTSGPKPGDQIFFTSDGGKTSSHTGLVVKVDGSKVYTIEGNTSSTAGVVANGGCVREKSYSLTYSKILGYGRPNYSIVEKEKQDMTEEQVKTIARTVVSQMMELDSYPMFVRNMEKYREDLGKLPTPDWAQTEHELARAAGFTDGTRPCDFSTRQEVFSMVLRALKK